LYLIIVLTINRATEFARI